MAAAALLLPALAALPAHGAAAGCSVDYTVNQWSGGFTAQIAVTNLGPAVNGWRVAWNYQGDQHITSGWNATITQTGTAVTASDAGYNAAIPTGGSTSFGVQGTWSAADPAPTAFTLNGTACTTNGTPPTTPPTSPSTTPPTTPPTTPTTTPPTTPPTSSPPTGCSGAVICSDFEDQSGPAPSGQWQPAAPDCSGSGAVTVDTAVAHSGSRSLRVDGHAGYCNHAFVADTTDLSTLGPVMYVRMWVRHTTALPAAHVAFVSMPDSSQGGRALRIGGQNGALQWNRESDDATLPEQSPAGVAQSAPLPTGSWQCLRFAVDTTAPSLRTWLGDQEVPGLRVDGVPTRDVDGQWLSRSTPPRPTALRLGWESYGTGDDTLWFDDVAVGSAPIGC
ncbi:cellulose-binding domain-containing protein [Streptomyces sp. NBC_01198]|nr:cellulose-binding domain-containing protein [Streptomyces sp. NBC_01198]